MLLRPHASPPPEVPVLPYARNPRLGEFALLVDGTSIHLPNPDRAPALPAYGRLHHGPPQAGAHLAFLLWPDSVEAQDAINAVCTGQGALDVLEGVTTLVDVNLLLPGTARVGSLRIVMRETIREFACEQMEANGDGRPLHAQHLAHFLALAQEDQMHWQNS